MGEARRACGRAGPYRSAGGRLVGECDDAARRRVTPRSFSGSVLPLPPPAAPPPTSTGWIENHFIDQVVGEQGLAESAVSVHHEITAIFVLELGHGGDGVVADEREVVPVSVLQRRGEYVLANRVYRVCVWPGLLGYDFGELLVGASSHEHSAEGV